MSYSVIDSLVNYFIFIYIYELVILVRLPVVFVERQLDYQLSVTTVCLYCAITVSTLQFLLV